MICKNVVEWYFYFGEWFILHTLKLLTIIFYLRKYLGHSLEIENVAGVISTSTKTVIWYQERKKGDEGGDTKVDKPFLDM